jgi:hypothetical protein
MTLPMHWERDRAGSTPPVWFGKCPACGEILAKPLPNGEFELGPEFERIEGVWVKGRPLARQQGRRARAARAPAPEFYKEAWGGPYIGPGGKKEWADWYNQVTVQPGEIVSCPGRRGKSCGSSVRLEALPTAS